MAQNPWIHSWLICSGKQPAVIDVSEPGGMHWRQAEEPSHATYLLYYNSTTYYYLLTILGVYGKDDVGLATTTCYTCCSKIWR